MNIKCHESSKPKHRPNEWWGIDMTKVLTTDEGSTYIVVVKDWKKFSSSCLKFGEHYRTHALEATLFAQR